MLGDRAVAESRRIGDGVSRLRAEALALSASNRLGHGVTVTERAIAAVRDADSGGDMASTAELRVELASCARGSGSYEVALRLLHAVLEQEHMAPVTRAHALIELAASLPVHRGGSERAAALDEAERLCAAESGLGRDTARLLRAGVNAERACQHRRHGEFEAASGVAETGLALVERLDEPAADSGDVHARLVLERVQALLDLGRHSEAMRVAAPALRQPLRAAAANPTGWLRFALATRVHAPEGEYRTAVWLLTEALAGAERHDLGHLQAEVLSALSHLHERCEDFAEALRCLRGAHAADRRWRDRVHSARIRLLEEFPQPSAAEVAVPRQQTSSQGAPAPERSAPPNEPPDRAETVARPRTDMFPDLAREIRRAARREPEVGEPQPTRQDAHVPAQDSVPPDTALGYSDGRGPAPWERPNEAGFGAEAPMPDVTTIMPVVDVPARQEEPASWPEEPSFSATGAHTRADRFDTEPDVVPEEGEPRHFEEPAEEAPAQEEVSAGDFLATHRELLRDLPAIRVGRKDPESSGEGGLADLLAEALVAYRGGRHDEPSTRTPANHHVEPDASEAVGYASRTAQQESAEDSSPRRGRARHRHAASESATFESSSWTPPAH